MNAEKTVSVHKKSLEAKLTSIALTQALTHVKEFMTDSQKSLVLLREGKLLMDSGDYKGAIDCFNEGISYNPSVSLFNMKGACHKALEKFSEAYFDYSYTIRLEPENGSHYCSRGQCLAKLKKFDMAIEDLDVAVQLDPSVTHLYARACIFTDFGKFELAIEDLTAAIGDDSTTIQNDMKVKCKYKRSLAYFELQMFDLVVRDCTSVLHSDPNNVPIRALLGRSLKILNEHKRAEEHLTTAILMDETQASLYAERGDIRFRTGQKNKIIEAIYDFDRAVKLLETKLTTGGLIERLNASAGRIQTGAKVSRVTLSGPTTKAVDAEPSIEEAVDAKIVQDPVSSILRANSKHTIINQSNKPSLSRSSSISVPTTQVSSSLSSSQVKEIEEQLAETLFKRAQAKLMIGLDAVNIESALNDAIKSSSFSPEDDEYQMVIATCYIRLNRFADAKRVLQHILSRSPENYKALYSFSFCQRATGSRNVAIEGLTKVISACTVDLQSFSTNALSFAIDKVFEMRGILFHELQAHKLALQDLGKAIALNPLVPDSFYMRGDCHSKLGNYELALADFNAAESRNFSDMCSLFVSRGHVLRLLGRGVDGQRNFEQAILLMDSSDLIGRVRIQSFIAFCQIDAKEYASALGTLQEALHINSEVLVEKEAAFGKYRSTKAEENPNENSVMYLRRVEWILNYHTALCYYMSGSYEQAEQVLLVCICEESQPFVADNVALGTQLYFLALTLIQLKKFDEASVYLSDCAQTHWMQVPRNLFLYTYTLAKLLQCRGMHREAITEFTTAVTTNPSNAYCYFRRGWSHKATGNFNAAGEDFEQAKLLQPADPNFSLDYRRIHTLDYMVIGSEPDLVEPFPALLPVPGMRIH